eukprot:6195037-Pleurochrysis_carterae.AAC.7
MRKGASSATEERESKESPTLSLASAWTTGSLVLSKTSPLPVKSEPPEYALRQNRKLAFNALVLDALNALRASSARKYSHARCSYRRLSGDVSTAAHVPWSSAEELARCECTSATPLASVRDKATATSTSRALTSAALVALIGCTYRIAYDQPAASSAPSGTNVCRSCCGETAAPGPLERSSSASQGCWTSDSSKGTDRSANVEIARPAAAPRSCAIVGSVHVGEGAPKTASVAMAGHSAALSITRCSGELLTSAAMCAS